MIWPRWLTGLLFVGGLLLLALIAKLAGKLSDRFGETWVPPEQREEARRRKEEAARRAEPEPVPRERPAGPEEPRGPVYPPFFWKAAIPCIPITPGKASPMSMGITGFSWRKWPAQSMRIC